MNEIRCNSLSPGDMSDVVPSDTRRVALTTILSLFAAFPSFAQEPPQAPLDGGGETIEVNLVNLAVYVTDRDGFPVTGLENEDFELKVDGQSVDITHFSAIENQPVFLVVFIDNANTEPLLRNRILERIRPFLMRRVQRGDYIHIVNFDGGEQGTQTFTRDLALVDDVLTKIRRVAPRPVIATIRSRLEALEELIDTLAGLPGRRVVLLISDLRTSSSEFLAKNGSADGAYLNDVFYPPGTLDLNVVKSRPFDLLDKITNQSNFHQVSFSLLNRGHTYRYGSEMHTFDDWRYSGGEDDRLFALTDHTGGQRILWWKKASKELKDVSDSLDFYYSLGFKLPEKSQRAKVKVTVRRRGLRVRHRDTLYGKTLAQQGVDRALSTLIYGIIENPLSLKLVAGEARAFDGDLKVLPVDLRFPLEKVTLIPRGEEGHLFGQLSIFFVARDGAGRLTPSRSTRVFIEIPRHRLAADHQVLFSHEMKLLFRSGAYEIAVCVHDDFEGKDSCNKGKVDIPTASTRHEELP